MSGRLVKFNVRPYYNHCCWLSMWRLCRCCVDTILHACGCSPFHCKKSTSSLSRTRFRSSMRTTKPKMDGEISTLFLDARQKKKHFKRRGEGRWQVKNGETRFANLQIITSHKSRISFFLRARISSLCSIFYSPWTSQDWNDEMDVDKWLNVEERETKKIIPCIYLFVRACSLIFAFSFFFCNICCWCDKSDQFFWKKESWVPSENHTSCYTLLYFATLSLASFIWCWWCYRSKGL